MPADNRSQLLTDILSRAASDRTFRVALLNEPASTIQTAFGVQVPQNYRLKFIERGAADSLIVLPDLVAAGELTDDELEDVAGGTTPEPPPTWRL
ncbi:MAG TPA: NHLP leader peptide family RiPP precursor [Longimicrobium sp.]|jgi:hypothetical protein|nr:NHLP leader peptide family RiPP precursor [Longimicrobium sp.]